MWQAGFAWCRWIQVKTDAEDVQAAGLTGQLGDATCSLTLLAVMLAMQPSTHWEPTSTCASIVDF